MAVGNTSVLEPLAPRRVLRQDLVPRLILAILTGELKGDSRLVEQELASRLGVSRTPVREAIGELASMGLVELRPGVGGVVLPFGPRQLNEIYVVRAVLEAEATRLATERADEQALAPVRQTLAALAGDTVDDPAWSQREIEADRAFHAMVAASCGNHRLHQEINRYRKFIDSVRAALAGRREPQRAAVEQHLAVLEAMAQRDAQAAAEAMRQHITQAAVAAVSALFDQ